MHENKCINVTFISNSHVGQCWAVPLNTHLQWFLPRVGYSQYHQYNDSQHAYLHQKESGEIILNFQAS